MEIRKGKTRIKLTDAQLARAAAEHARKQGQGAPQTSTATRTPAEPSRPALGTLVAASMPKHPRVIVSRIHSYDRDGEARGARGEHLGYANRRDSRGNRKLTLCTVLDSNLTGHLTGHFPNLRNPARPGTR